MKVNERKEHAEQLLNNHVNTDQRKQYEWQSKWCKDSSTKIRNEAIWMGLLFLLCLILLLLTWSGVIYNWLSHICEAGCSLVVSQRYFYIFIGGLFGGTIFGLKYLYKVVARGYWHLDRRLWRLFSPFLSAGTALAFGTLFDSGMIGLNINTNTGSGYFSLGFLIGYFADSAIAKMQEVAETLFAKKN